MSLELNYRMSEEVAALFEALSSAQKIMNGAIKDATNPHFGNRYADLASIWDACRIPLAENGLTILQPVSADGSKVTVSTLLAHKTGQWIAADLTLTSLKADPQGIGSAITYGRRYGLAAMVGIAPEDDDGNAASRETGSRKAQEQVAERKLGKVKEQAENKAKEKPAIPAENLKYFQDIKAEIGSKLYYEVLNRHNFKHSTEIPDTAQARQIYKEMGEAKKAITAASHGEGAHLDEKLFNSLPDTSRAKLFIVVREKIAEAVGSKDTAIEEYERIRRESTTQWACYEALLKAHESFAKQSLSTEHSP